MRMYTKSAMLCTVAFFFVSSAAADGFRFRLPSLGVQSAIKSVAPVKEPSKNPTGLPDSTNPPPADTTGPAIKTLKIDPDTLPPSSASRASVDAEGKTNIPIASQNSMLLQFQPDLSQADIDSYLKSNNMVVLKAFPSIGAVQVQADLSKYFKPQLSDNSENDAVLRGLIEASKDFRKDPRILAATPDLVLHGQAAITNFVTPSEVAQSEPGDKKIVDWGISDIQADQLWELPGARDGVVFGIMDVGFAKHDDLVFIDRAKDTPVEDHGTHVAGIACGSHNTAVGVEGVLPNCFIRAGYGNVFFKSTAGGSVTQFMTLFSQILGSLTTFIENSEDVSAFNISLGYNWESNFGINPDAPEAKDWRALVDIQGPFLVTLLQTAEKNGKVIFSAAGNDSTGISPPIDAKYASPFNWAAIVAREQGIKSGIIVEAHDSQGNRASFSNAGGEISCPGVDIVSTVAFDANHSPSTSAYGKMSGTSMASPYCAAGLVLFRLVRPDYTAEQVMNCFVSSGPKSDSGVPMLKLHDALSKCP